SRYLTIYFIVYIIEMCYFVYASFFVKGSFGFEKLFFLFLAIEFFILIVYVTLECSKVVNNNRQMYGQSLRMAIQIERLHRFNVRQMLKLDQMIMNSKNVSRICFKLTN